MARQLVLIRHGYTGDDYKGRHIGTTDISLAPLGVLQAKALAGPVRTMQPATVLASPMMRARQTAEAAVGPIYAVDPDLGEMAFGACEGLTFAEIQASYPDIIASWAEYNPKFRFPEGESIGEFIERMQRVAKRLSDDPSDTVIAITHGGVIRTLTCLFLGLDPRHYILFQVDPASVTTIALFGERGLLNCLNDVCHLSGVRNG